jgi:hypothetical protein
MGKHVSDIDKAVFLIDLQYIHQAEAAKRAELFKQMITDLKNRFIILQIERAEQGLPSPILIEQIARKPDNRTKLKITNDEMLKLLNIYTLNKSKKRNFNIL